MTGLVKSIKGETLQFLGFLIFVCFMAIYFANYYYVPDSDFFDMQNTAISFADFNLPESYQRLPLYSMLMAMLSIILPVKNNLLLAAQLINLIAFIISTVLLYLVSKQLLGKTAFLVTYLYAMHPQTIYLTAQPKAEMLTVMIVLLGIHLSLKTREESYLAAFLASITRYEGSLLIPSLVFKDFISSKRFFRCLFLGFISSLGLILWLMLNYKATGHINPYYVYFDRTLTPAGLSFVSVTVKTLMKFINSRLIKLIPLKVQIITISILTIMGFLYFLRSSFNYIIPIVIFFCSCLLMNILYFGATAQHAFLIIWIILLISVGLLKHISLFLLPLIRKSYCLGIFERNFKQNIFPFIFIGSLSLIVVYSNIISVKLVSEYALFYICSFAVVLFYIVNNIDVNRYGHFIVTLLLVLFCGFISARNIVAIKKKIEYSKYIKAELRLVGEWYSEYCIDGEKMVVSEPLVVRYYTDRSGNEDIVSLGDFKALSYRSFIDELKKRNVEYIVWDSSHGNIPESSVYYYYYRKYKMHLISVLKNGHDTEHFKVIKKFGIGDRYAFIYRFVL